MENDLQHWVAFHIVHTPVYLCLRELVLWPFFKIEPESVFSIFTRASWMNIGMNLLCIVQVPVIYVIQNSVSHVMWIEIDV